MDTLSLSLFYIMQTKLLRSSKVWQPLHICPFFILIHYFVLSFHSHNLPHLTNFTTTSSQRATKYPSYIMVKIDEADRQMFYEFSNE